MKVALMACSSNKNSGIGPLSEIHAKSALFRYCLKYAKGNFDRVYAFSGQLGLVEIDTVVENHNGSIDHIKYKSFKKWLLNTRDQIEKTIPEGSELHFFCGNKYRRIIPRLEEKYKCIEPLKGLPIGKQISFFKKFYKED